MMEDKRLSIIRYSPDNSSLWDEFASCARNSSLLALRGYMDYHSDRFEDCSLMAFKGNSLVAILPANVRGDILYSHQGLTFGGWILPPRHLDGADILEIFRAAIAFCRDMGMKSIVYKPVPTLYHRQPSQEDIYALQRLGGSMTGCNLSETIRLNDNPGFNTLRRRTLRKALKDTTMEMVEVGSDDLRLQSFYRLLSSCLEERFGARPVHSLEELRLLRGRFPENIRIFGIRQMGTMEFEAGICIYAWKGVAHCQYIATTERGRRENLLTMLVWKLLEIFQDYRYFDFGTSNETDGSLNEGLLRQKASFGASGITFPTWQLNL
ncbi:MAG: GNAT family N-acetyltransferase [Clostridium sp.]|nr:GNAT family N-acetyltransferase [Prevotella sp.]MCM1429554.1 GNAT family N-acetyltransferase [Clostridium sp.]MCM1476038.1 GNAT family N-acetyltransferase [Muribaculaceae bacterium]